MINTSLLPIQVLSLDTTTRPRGEERQREALALLRQPFPDEASCLALLQAHPDLASTYAGQLMALMGGQRNWDRLQAHWKMQCPDENGALGKDVLEKLISSAIDIEGSLDDLRLIMAAVPEHHKNDLVAVGMQHAVERRHGAIVDFLLQSGFDVHATDSEGNTLLMKAVLGGRLEFAKWLLGRGVDVNAVDVHGKSALIKAIRQGPDALTLLLRAGAEVNARTSKGHPALLWSVIYGRLDAVRVLLDNQADIDAQDHFGYTALHVAESLMHMGIAKLLKDKGARTDLLNANGVSAQQLAEQNRKRALWVVGGGTSSCLKWCSQVILERDALTLLRQPSLDETQCLTFLGRYPKFTSKYFISLMVLIAAQRDWGGLWARLTELNPDACKLPTLDALFQLAHQAVRTEGSLQDLQVVFDATPLVERGRVARSVLVDAVELGHGAIIHFLLTSWANIYSRSETGETFLMHMVARRNAGFVTWLLKNGVDIDAVDDQGFSALMLAAGLGWPDMVTLLLKARADVNLRTLTGGTALMRATYYGYVDVVHALIRYKADLNAQDGEGLTALHLAEREQNTVLVKLLKRMGARTDLPDRHGVTAQQLAKMNRTRCASPTSSGDESCVASTVLQARTRSRPHVQRRPLFKVTRDETPRRFPLFSAEDVGSDFHHAHDVSMPAGLYGRGLSRGDRVQIEVGGVIELYRLHQLSGDVEATDNNVRGERFVLVRQQRGG